MTLEQAHLHLCDRERIKKACWRMNEISDAGRILTPEERAARATKLYREEMARRRKHFTGSEELTDE